MKIGLLASMVLWAFIAWMLAGCSVKFEVGYHGETGRDDRVQTQLVKESKK